MRKFYVVKNIGGGFDGLTIEGTPFDSDQTVAVARIIDSNANVGDRTVSLPVPAGALYIGQEFLEQTDDPGIREFASDNPFGKQLLEGSMTCGDVKVVYSQYENVLSVTVIDSSVGRTLFSQYFSKNFEGVKQELENILKNNVDSDPDDLVFKLRDLKEAETRE